MSMDSKFRSSISVVLPVISSSRSRSQSCTASEITEITIVSSSSRLLMRQSFSERENEWGRTRGQAQALAFTRFLRCGMGATTWFTTKASRGSSSM